MKRDAKGRFTASVLVDATRLMDGFRAAWAAVPLGLTRTPIYDAVVQDQGFDPIDDSKNRAMSALVAMGGAE